jgi:adenosine deaminase
VPQPETDSGESKIVQSETTSMIEFGPDRLGHALFLTPKDLVLLEEQRTNRSGTPIAIECCPTSNVMTLELAQSSHSHNSSHHQDSLIRGLTQHPQLARWLRTDAGNDYPLSINTDDPGVFHTNSTREWMLLARTFQLSYERLAELASRPPSQIFDTSPNVTRHVALKVQQGLTKAMAMTLVVDGDGGAISRDLNNVN